MKSWSALKVIPLLLTLGACSNNVSTDTIVEAKAPDKDFAIEVISGLPSSSFGPHPVRIYVIRGEKRDLLIRTPVFNDGKPLSQKNAEVEFKGDVVYICLKGDTQIDKQISFNSATKDYLVKDGDCEYKNSSNPKDQLLTAMDPDFNE